jgi:hypothetical protein
MNARFGGGYIMIDLDYINKYRFWEQYTLTGKKNVINYGKVLSYLSDARNIQSNLGCGRLYTSTYLGIEPRPDAPQKEYLLVVELFPARGATYENQPISHIRFEIGKKQVILKIRDLQTRQFHKQYVFNCEDAVETVQELRDYFMENGLMPIISSDYYFGQYKTELQYVYDNVVERLDEEEVEELKKLLDGKGFEFIGDMCKKSFGNFRMRIYQKNKYGSYILAFQDFGEKLFVHWALKGKDLVDAVVALEEIYERWKQEIKGVR